MTANMEVYKDGQLVLPRTVKCYNGQNNIHGTIGGITELTLIHSTLYMSATSMSEGSNMAGRYEFNNINVMANGVLKFIEDVTSELTLSSGKLHIAPTGMIQARELTVTADTITVEEGGTIILDARGFGTDGPGISYLNLARD